MAACSGSRRSASLWPPVSISCRGSARCCSYAGQFNMGVVADRDAHPDLEVLVSAMTEELRALGLSTRLAEVA
jgi:hypothetical protein